MPLCSGYLCLASGGVFLSGSVSRQRSSGLFTLAANLDSTCAPTFFPFGVFSEKLPDVFATPKKGQQSPRLQLLNIPDSKLAESVGTIQGLAPYLGEREKNGC